jgi:hypothetical protein
MAVQACVVREIAAPPSWVVTRGHHPGFLSSLSNDEDR